MAVNKNFVVKNGLEVATDLLVATNDSNSVGIASTVPSATLGVGGGIAAVDGLFVGILTAQSALEVGAGGTVITAEGNTGLVGINTTSPQYALHIVSSSGISTGIYVDGSLEASDVTVGSAITVSGAVDVNSVTVTSADITNANITGIATIVYGDFTDIDVSGATIVNNLNATGITTLATAEITSATISNLTVTPGISTLSATEIDETLNVIGFTSVSSARAHEINVTGVVTATTFFGNLTGDVTGTASTATDAINVRVADEGTDTTCFPLFVTAATGDLPPKSNSNFTYNSSTETLASTNFNSTSDVTLKTDIRNIENALELLQQLNGVKFTWKELGTPSAGVIAQDVEQVLPELVAERTDNHTKTVNYNGIIGLLVEAVKELANRVEALEGDK